VVNFEVQKLRGEERTSAVLTCPAQWIKIAPTHLALRVRLTTLSSFTFVRYTYLVLTNEGLITESWWYRSDKIWYGRNISIKFRL